MTTATTTATAAFRLDAAQPSRSRSPLMKQWVIPSTLPVSSQVAIADDEAEILTSGAESALNGSLGGSVGGDGMAGGGGGGGGFSAEGGDEQDGEAEEAEETRGDEESEYSDESELEDVNDEAEGVKASRAFDGKAPTMASASGGAAAGTSAFELVEQLPWEDGVVWGDDGDAGSEGSEEGDDDSFVEEFDDEEVRATLW